MRLSFKKQKRQTGLAGVGYPNPSTNIKADGKVVGVIAAPNWQTEDNKWSVRFTVLKDVTSPTDKVAWKWITLKARFDSESATREWITANFEAIVGRYKLHSFDNDVDD